MDKIFYDNQDIRTGRYIIIDEDENSIWAYLTLPNDTTVDKDCFLATRKEIELETFDIKAYRRKKSSPPIIKKYATPESHLPHLKEEHISVEWGKNGNVILKVNEKPFLLFIAEADKGFSKSLSDSSIYGNEWIEEEFNKEFSENSY